ncbi:MAG: DNA-binding protein [Xenococcaceae cyanobacterium]
MSLIFVQTTKASSLLKICPQRVRQLLKQGRIKGAFKDKGGFWQIPLYWGVPQVIPANRGLEGTWKKRFSKKTTFIHVIQSRLRHNRKYGTKDPVITIREGDRQIYCHEAAIEGNCRIVYQPHKPLDCGAILWIELEPTSKVKSKIKN